MIKKVLVAYASKAGSTAEIAEAIGSELRRYGHAVDVRPAAEVGSLHDYDAVVLGSALYMFRWRRDAVRFLRRHEQALRSRQVWLFHSGPLGTGTDEPQAAPGNVARLITRIGLRSPTTFPGRLDAETARGWIARQMAKGKMAGDFRDWPKIERWAHEVAESIAATRPAAH